MSSVVCKFLHTRMRVSVLDESAGFYQKVFGLEVTRKHESPRGSKLVFLSVPNSDEEIELTYFPGSGPVVVQEDLMPVQLSHVIHYLAVFEFSVRKSNSIFRLLKSEIVF